MRILIDLNLYNCIIPQLRTKRWNNSEKVSIIYAPEDINGHIRTDKACMKNLIEKKKKLSTSINFCKQNTLVNEYKTLYISIVIVRFNVKWLRNIKHVTHFLLLITKKTINKWALKNSLNLWLEVLLSFFFIVFLCLNEFSRDNKTF